ncbi:MAG: thiamine biosynthesis protein ThiF [Desulfitibacter sp. BRH_c19]|nr:MAG: thiamine biosynthesis protein ThiF [Desulfitibacter sp. BRH_c19]
MSISERYSRQVRFSGIGEEGQKKISQARVAVIGMGALGTVIANNLVRSGVGYIRLVDRDFIEISNLQRQVLYDENDIKQGLPKAIAAAQHLKKVNSDVIIDSVVVDVNAGNISKLIKDVDLVMDGSDNFEVRFLINDASIKHSVPWIYGGALGSYGMTMNIIPGKTPCFRCLIDKMPTAGAHDTCSTAGVINMITGIVANYQSVEALKILINSLTIRQEVLFIDIWNNTIETFKINKNGECKACVDKEFEFLSRKFSSYASSLCGQNSIQIVPAIEGKLDFKTFYDKLKKVGDVTFNKFFLSFKKGEIEFTLFSDGRAIIKNVTEEKAARAIYSEYIGM